MVMLFFSDVNQYVPIKLYKTAGSIHLFNILGHLTPDQITLERKLLYLGKVFLLYRTFDCFKDKLSITTVIFIMSENNLPLL